MIFLKLITFVFSKMQWKFCYILFDKILKFEINWINKIFIKNKLCWCCCYDDQQVKYELHIACHGLNSSYTINHAFVAVWHSYLLIFTMIIVIFLHYAIWRWEIFTRCQLHSTHKCMHVFIFPVLFKCLSILPKYMAYSSQNNNM